MSLDFKKDYFQIIKELSEGISPELAKSCFIPSEKNSIGTLSKRQLLKFILRKGLRREFDDLEMITHKAKALRRLHDLGLSNKEISNIQKKRYLYEDKGTGKIPPLF